MRYAPCIVLVLLAHAASAPALADGVDAAEKLLEEMDYRAARELLQAEVDARPSPRAHLLLTRACNRFEDWECGVRHGERAVAALPESSDAHYQYALALRHKISKVSKLKAPFIAPRYSKVLLRSIELDADNLDAREEEIGWLINAPGFAGGDRDQARRRIDDLEQLDWARAMRWAATLARREGDDEEAGRIYQRILAREPDRADVRYDLAFWYMRREQWRRADESLTGLETSDEPVRRFGALYQRGRVRVLGKFEQEQAVRFLAEFIAHVDEELPVPSRSDASWRQGMAYEQLGREAEARAAYRRALALDPDNKAARDALRALKGR